MSFNELYLQTGRYENEFNEIELIGCGGFGSVYKAVNKFNKNEYAIKKLEIPDSNLSDNAVKEIKVWANMSSDYVVQYISSWIESNDSYNLEPHPLLSAKTKERAFSSSSVGKSSLKQNKAIVHIQMELCCSTLKDIIDKINTELNQTKYEVSFTSLSPIGYFIASELFLEILECVHYLHSFKEPVIHRDLKPTNILITDGSNGRFIKIADFGLATTHVIDLQSHTQALGTQHYMAPEVKNSKKYDTKADMFSLGVIMKELFNLDVDADHTIWEPTWNSHTLRAKCVNAYLLYHNLVDTDPLQRHSCEHIIQNKKMWALSLSNLLNEKTFTDEEKFRFITCNSEESSNLFCSIFLRQRFFCKNTELSNENSQRIGMFDASNYLKAIFETAKNKEIDKFKNEFSSNKFEQVFIDDTYKHNLTLIIEKGAKLEVLTNPEMNNFKCSLDYDNLKFELHGDGILPEIKLTGIYDLKGKMFRFFPIKGNGNILVHLENITADFIYTLSVKEDKFSSDFLDLKLSFSSAKLNFENLIDSNLSPVLNSLINYLAKPLADKLILENSEQMDKIKEGIKTEVDKALLRWDVDAISNIVNGINAK